MAAQRVWRALKERRGALLFLALFWALVFFVLQPLSQQRYDALCLQHEPVFSLPECDDTVQLTGGITLVQTFRPEKDCRGLSLRVATYRRTNSARVTFFLMDAQDDVLFSQDQDSAAWPDNGYVSLALPEALKAGAEYTLLIFSAEGPDGLNPGLHLLNGLGEGDQPLERNGQLLAFSLQLAATVEHPQVYTLYTALLIWLVVGSLALALLLRQADERGFLWYALLVGWLVALLLPFPDERDEGTHFFKAVALTEGKLEEVQDELIGCELPQGTLAPFSLRRLAASEASDWPGPLEGEKEFIALSYVANVIPVEHAVLALPVALLRALGAPLWLTVFLSRLWCYALYTALCWAAIRRAGRFKPIFFVVALLPFAQRMAGLVSTDPLLLGGALLFTATVLRLWQSGQEGQSRTLSGWDMASLLLSALLAMNFILPAASLAIDYGALFGAYGDMLDALTDGDESGSEEEASTQKPALTGRQIPVTLASGRTVQVHEDFKNYMDAMEKFFDDYVAILNAPDPDPLKLMQFYADYATYTAELYSYNDSDDLDEGDMAYYMEVRARPLSGLPN